MVQLIPKVQLLQLPKIDTIAEIDTIRKIDTTNTISAVQTFAPELQTLRCASNDLLRVSFNLNVSFLPVSCSFST